MSIQRDVDPVKDKQVNKMLDEKYGKQTKRIITGDDLRTIKALLVQKALEKRAITKHPGHPDQSVHSKKRGKWGTSRRGERRVEPQTLSAAERRRAFAAETRRESKKPARAGKAKEGIASRIGRAKSRVARALRTATPMGMARAGAQFGETLRHRQRRRKMAKAEQVNSIIKRLNEIIKTETR